MTTQALIAAYQNAMLQILARIQMNAQVDSLTLYEQQLIGSIDQILKSLGLETAEWLSSAVPSAYKSAVISTYRQLAYTPTLEAGFAGINQAAVKVIVDNQQGVVNTALQKVGRILNDQIREASIEATKKKLTLNQSIRDMQKGLEKTLADQGCSAGVPDSKGRIQPLDAYGEMVARTTTRETTNTATMNTAHELNCHLFKMSEHYPTCKICAPRQGRIYRDAYFPAGDERNRFPHISNAFPGWPRYRTVHPRCRHVIVAIGWEALSRETQLAYLAEADKPFEVDTRSEKEIKAYNLGQAESRMMREDRKQWARMRQRLGDDAPKSFSAFRRIKYSDGGNPRASYSTDAEGNTALHAGKPGNSRSWSVLQTKYKAMDFYEKAIENEPEISRQVKAIANKTGMEVVGFDYRIKSKDSFLRKVEANYSPDGTPYSVRDIVRYTFTANTDELTLKTQEAMYSFEQTGYNTIVVKNTWVREDSPYKGINTTLVAPNGQEFELQYHTPESFELKNGKLHELYEKQRILKNPMSKEYIQLQNQMVDLSDALTVPVNVQEVTRR